MHPCMHLPAPPSTHLFHASIHFFKVIFILLITCKTLCTPVSVLPQTKLFVKILLPSEACCNSSIPQWALLNLDISSKYSVGHRPSSFVATVLSVCCLPYSLSRWKAFYFREVSLSCVFTYAPRNTFHVCAYHSTKNTVVFPQKQAP